MHTDTKFSHITTTRFGNAVIKHQILAIRIKITNRTTNKGYVLFKLDQGQGVLHLIIVGFGTHLPLDTAFTALVYI
jgi:hypothetical protein